MERKAPFKRMLVGEREDFGPLQKKRWAKEGNDENEGPTSAVTATRDRNIRALTLDSCSSPTILASRTSGSGCLLPARSFDAAATTCLASSFLIARAKSESAGSDMLPGP